MQVFSQDYPEAQALEDEAKQGDAFPLYWTTLAAMLSVHYKRALSHLNIIQRMLQDGRMPEFEYDHLEASLLGAQAVKARAHRASFRALGYDREPLRLELIGAFEQVENVLVAMIEERDAQPSCEISATADARQLDNRMRGLDIAAELARRE